MLKVIEGKDAQKIQDDIEILEQTGRVRYIDSIVFDKKIVAFIGYTERKQKRKTKRGR